jgi:hypothetical protein
VIFPETRQISLREHDYVPEGLQSNAGDADLRVFTVSSADFESRPLPEQTLLWDGVSYSIWAVRNSDVGGQTVGYRLFVYRAPVPDSATDGSGGVRKTYVPPPTEI